MEHRETSLARHILKRPPHTTMGFREGPCPLSPLLQPGGGGDGVSKLYQPLKQDLPLHSLTAFPSKALTGTHSPISNPEEGPSALVGSAHGPWCRVCSGCHLLAVVCRCLKSSARAISSSPLAVNPASSRPLGGRRTRARRFRRCGIISGAPQNATCPQEHIGRALARGPAMQICLRVSNRAPLGTAPGA